MNFKEQMDLRTQEVQCIIEKYLPEEEGFQKTLLEAVNYSMTAGGKRLRPLLMLETYRMFGGSTEVVEPFMAAIEMIHTHSLIHDDLPAMDNDEYRRGRKTTHVVFGEAMGILAGAVAFELEPENERIGCAIRTLSRKTGIYGMMGGQSVDVASVGQELSREKLNFIYRLKTSALIEASMVVGAVLAGASEQELETVEQIASDIGLAFQIQDDILDVTSTMEVLGKPVMSDEKNKKTTYVTLEGLHKATADVKEVSDRAIQTLDGLGRENAFLRELILQLVYREK